MYWSLGIIFSIFSNKGQCESEPWLFREANSTCIPPAVSGYTLDTNYLLRMSIYIYIYHAYVQLSKQVFVFFLFYAKHENVDLKNSGIAKVHPLSKLFHIFKPNLIVWKKYVAKSLKILFLRILNFILRVIQKSKLFYRNLLYYSLGIIFSILHQ